MDRRISVTSKNRRKKSVIPECIKDISINEILNSKNLSVHRVDRINENVPILWERMSNGYRIIDLREERMAEAMKLIINNFLPSEPTCHVTNMTNDIVSSKSYLQSIFGQMSDLESFCALKEGTGELVGVLIGSRNKTVDKNYNEIRGQSISKIIILWNCLFAKARADETFEIGQFYRISVLCVKTDHRNEGIGTALVRSCISRVNEFQVPGCVAAFSSAASQTIGERLNFVKLTEISYKNFVTPHNDERPFEEIPPGNYSVCLMILVVRSRYVDETAANSNDGKRSRSSGGRKKI